MQVCPSILWGNDCLEIVRNEDWRRHATCFAFKEVKNVKTFYFIRCTLLHLVSIYFLRLPYCLNIVFFSEKVTNYLEASPDPFALYKPNLVHFFSVFPSTSNCQKIQFPNSGSKIFLFLHFFREEIIAHSFFQG